MSLWDRIRQALRSAPERRRWVKRMETTDVTGRLEERTFLYPAHEEIAKITERFDAEGRRTEAVTLYRDGTSLRGVFDPRGEHVADEWYGASGELERRLTIEYDGGEAIVTTYDAAGRQVDRSRQPKRTL